MKGYQYVASPSIDALKRIFEGHGDRTIAELVRELYELSDRINTYTILMENEQGEHGANYKRVVDADEHEYMLTRQHDPPV